MKAFLEEYGLIIVAVIVIIAVIGIAITFNGTFKTNIETILANFFTKSGAGSLT